jgi:hypothetical protein
LVGAPSLYPHKHGADFPRKEIEDPRTFYKSRAFLARIDRFATRRLHTVDPVSFSVVTIVTIGIGLVACWLPTRRAMRVDPAVTLRVE